jgi:hypothetical protein
LWVGPWVNDGGEQKRYGREYYVESGRPVALRDSTSESSRTAKKPALNHSCLRTCKVNMCVATQHHINHELNQAPPVPAIGTQSSTVNHRYRKNYLFKLNLKKNNLIRSYISSCILFFFITHFLIFLRIKFGANIF